MILRYPFLTNRESGTGFVYGHARNRRRCPAGMGDFDGRESEKNCCLAADVLRFGGRFARTG